MVDTFRIEVKGLDVVRSRLRLMPERIQRNIMRGGLRAAAVVVQKESKAGALAIRRTGKLARSIKVSTRVLFGGAQIEAKVKATARYAPIVEGGARAHSIAPKRAKALRIGSNLVERVNHPGFAGRRFMETARQRSEPAANRAFQQYVATRVTRFWETGQ